MGVRVIGGVRRGFIGSRAISAWALACAAAMPSAALGQWIPEYRRYALERIGLFGPEQTSTTGLQSSTARFFALDASAGPDAVRTLVAGHSTRYSGAGAIAGRDAWVWDGTTTEIGLAGPEYLGSAGEQNSDPKALNAAGDVAGTAVRYGATGASNGLDAWVWDGTTTTRIGLIGPDNTGTAGYRFSEPQFINAAGHVAGYSNRVSGVLTENGRDAWVWNGSATVQVGLTGPAYTGSAGYRRNVIQLLNEAGQVAGFTQLVSGVNLVVGVDSWVWNGSSTMLLGLTGPGYTGSTGIRYTQIVSQNAAGTVIGFSQRYLGVNTLNGDDAWVWDAGTTTQIGLFGAQYEDASGYRSSQPLSLNAAGQVVGVSSRANASGQDAWVWRNGTTVVLGLTGAAYTGSTGYRFGSFTHHNNAGHVVGLSQRITGTTTSNGFDTWIWDGTTTRQIGLVEPVHTGTSGFRSSVPQLLGASGRVVGASTRITGVSTTNGRNTWVWDGATTTQIGLTAAVNTGTAGFQFSNPSFMNDAGVVAGVSRRITGLSANNGQDAWYFDPTTGVTHPIIASVRTSDNSAFAEPRILTADGFVLGTYTLYPGGVGNGESRAFIYRPDLGLIDLGGLVKGGLTRAGWSTLQRPEFADALRTIVGHGLAAGQTSGQSAFVMVDTGTSCSPCAADYDGDGGVTGADVEAFFAAFEEGDPCADIDTDGGITGADVEAFFFVFEAGGC